MEYIEGQPDAADRRRSQSALSTAYVILYAFIMTLVAFDMMMSLNPEWFSTLFGAYYFVVSFYAGLAFLAVVSTFGVKKMGMGNAIEKKQFHDLGKLLFAFCVVSLDFFYVQFLVIWYGNLPDETRYVIWRVIYDPWAALAWTVLIVLFIIPFLVLLLRKIKLEPVLLAVDLHLDSDRNLAGKISSGYPFDVEEQVPAPGNIRSADNPRMVGAFWFLRMLVFAEVPGPGGFRPDAGSCA